MGIPNIKCSCGHPECNDLRELAEDIVVQALAKGFNMTPEQVRQKGSINPAANAHASATVMGSMALAISVLARALGLKYEDACEVALHFMEKTYDIEVSGELKEDLDEDGTSADQHGDSMDESHDMGPTFSKPVKAPTHGGSRRIN